MSGSVLSLIFEADQISMKLIPIFSGLASVLMILAMENFAVPHEQIVAETGDCDTSKISFDKDIAPIFKESCKSCHSNFFPNGGLSLTSYEKIKEATQEKELLARIHHKPGVDPMPPDQPKLSDCKLAKIDQWVQAGFPEN